MCWLSKRKPVAKIAKRDIPVKKVIYTDGTAYFNHFNYKTRKVIPKVDIEIEKEDDFYGSFYTIESGYHSYSSKCVITDKKPDNSDVKQYIWVEYGYNCLLLQTYYTKQKEFRRIKIQNFIIPKGTKYYTNGKGEYVSELIKIV